MAPGGERPEHQHLLFGRTGPLDSARGQHTRKPSGTHAIRKTLYGDGSAERMVRLDHHRLPPGVSSCGHERLDAPCGWNPFSHPPTNLRKKATSEGTRSNRIQKADWRVAELLDECRPQ